MLFLLLGSSESFWWLDIKKKSFERISKVDRILNSCGNLHNLELDTPSIKRAPCF